MVPSHTENRTHIMCGDGRHGQKKSLQTDQTKCTIWSPGQRANRVEPEQQKGSYTAQNDQGSKQNDKGE